tara:strand:+ start:265 stop:504 length:240 start_codon:yes stop_codon:yes gene_type:complete
MSRVKKNDLVKLKDIPTYYDQIEMCWKLGIVLRGPYEDPVVVSHIRKSGEQITLLTIVCDVVAEGKIYKAIPIDLLDRC